MPVVIDGSGSINIGSFPVGAGPAFSAYSTVDQSVTSNVVTKVTLGAELFDTNNAFSSSRFTPTIAGYYQLNGLVRGASGSANVTAVGSQIYKNGSLLAASFTTSPGVSVLASLISEVVYLNGSTDYVELFGSVVATNPVFDYAADGSNCRFSGALVRAA